MRHQSGSSTSSWSSLLVLPIPGLDSDASWTHARALPLIWLIMWGRTPSIAKELPLKNPFLYNKHQRWGWLEQGACQSERSASSLMFWQITPNSSSAAPLQEWAQEQKSDPLSPWHHPAGLLMTVRGTLISIRTYLLSREGIPPRLHPSLVSPHTWSLST